MKKCKICKQMFCEDNFYKIRGKYLFPYCKACTKAKGVKWKDKNKKAVFKHSIKLKYGISLEIYENMRKIQDYCCAICKKSEKDQQYKTLSVDHDHNTGKVRGLLCSNCNHALGKFQDSVELLSNAIDYLKRLSYF